MTATDLEIAAIDDDGGTLGHPGIDVSLHFVQMLAGHERAHLRRFIFRAADSQCFDARCELGRQLIRNVVADSHRYRNGHTTLAG